MEFIIANISEREKLGWVVCIGGPCVFIFAFFWLQFCYHLARRLADKGNDSRGFQVYLLGLGGFILIPLIFTIYIVYKTYLLDPTR
jgi:hypothetical protein